MILQEMFWGMANVGRSLHDGTQSGNIIVNHAHSNGREGSHWWARLPSLFPSCSLACCDTDDEMELELLGRCYGTGDTVPMTSYDFRVLLLARGCEVVSCYQKTDRSLLRREIRVGTCNCARMIGRFISQELSLELRVEGYLCTSSLEQKEVYADGPSRCFGGGGGNVPRNNSNGCRLSEGQAGGPGPIGEGWGDGGSFRFKIGTNASRVNPVARWQIRHTKWR